jgi:ATP-dependent RNA helicase RhlE
MVHFPGPRSRSVSLFVVEGFMSFSELNLSEPLLRAVREADYQSATPIQTAAIPPILAGLDCLACAQTGTGKTAAFALPVLHRLGHRSGQERSRPIRVLVLAPTRELASQIAESFRTYGRYTGLRHAVVFGGVGQTPQVRALQRGVDIVVATPGRLLDLMNQGFVNLQSVETLILDEADQMFDMGFIHDLKRIVARVPRQRQTLLFSATMPQEIRRLAEQWLRDPVELSVAPQSTPAERIEQSVYFIDRGDKPRLLAHYLRDQSAQRAIVFTRTKHGADKLVRVLERGGIRAAAIHGNKSQNARQHALAQFKSQHPPVLVATDIAARGLDIDSVSHVVNYDLPMTAELYVHRIGRTARAGATGIAVTFCDREERSMLREIERLTRQRLNIAEHQFHAQVEPGGNPDTRQVQDRNRHSAHRAAPGNHNSRAHRKPFKGRGKAASPSNRFGRRLSAV